MEEKNILTEDHIEKKHYEENENDDSADHGGRKHLKTSSAKKSKVNPLRIENEKLKKQLEESRESYLRLGAEFQNFRKRFEKEKEETVLYANEKLIEMILPILDDFERSLSTSDPKKSFEAFRNGVELIYKNLLETLEKEGVKPIKAVGEEFDHNLHDALMMTEKEGIDAGKVVEEVMKGYYYKDKVLRHSKVIVAK